MISRSAGLIVGLTVCLGLGLAVQRLPLSDNSADQPLRVRVSQEVMDALLVSKVAPKYPAEAKAKGVRGKIVLRVIVNQEGAVSHVEVVSGHPLLIPAAIEAVRQWKYKPFLVKQRPVEVETTVEVAFALRPEVETRLWIKRPILA